MAANAGQHELMEILARLIEIESHSPPQYESKVAEYIYDFFRTKGVDTEITEVAPGRKNVIAQVEGSQPGPCLVLTGHMDTVPVDKWEPSEDPFKVTKANSKLYGRGVVDMKGALAAMMVALLTGRDAVKKGRLRFVGVAGEEGGGSVGTYGYIKDNPGTDYVVVGEPTELKICVAHKGSANFRINIEGQAAHSATPKEGLNAIQGAMETVKILNERIEPNLSSIENPYLGRSTLTVAGIKGGGRTDTVPASVEVLFNIRYIPEIDIENFIKNLQGELKSIEDQGFKVELNRHWKTVDSNWGPHNLNAVPLQTEITNPLVAASQQAFKDVYGKDTAIIGVPFWTDAALFGTQTGVNAIVFGPGSIKSAHSSNEFVDQKEVEDATSIYHNIIKQLCH